VPIDWEDALLSYLHDPPGKALDVRGHEEQATPLASLALGRPVDRDELHRHSRTEDQLASGVERVVPLPTAGPGGSRAVNPQDGILTVFHPLAGTSHNLDVNPLGLQGLAATLRPLVAFDPPRARFLAVWRWWRERLIERHAAWGRLPADTRLPDHTIWNHLDTVAGLRPALGQHGVALLSFSLGPVQPFIAAARSVRDLWTGSYLLAWLTFAGLCPVLDECGPAAVVSPALRGNPLMDLYLRNLAFGESPGSPRHLAGLVDPRQIASDRLLAPCLPNRFIALVPWGPEGTTASDLARQCENACRAGWAEICQKVHDRLDTEIRERHVAHGNGWDRLWVEQVRSYFEVRTSVVPINDCTDEALGRLLADSGRFEDIQPPAARVRDLSKLIPQTDQPGYTQDGAGRWMGAVEVLGRLAEATRSVRHVPDYQPGPDGQGYWAVKCSLLGSYEQMGPAERDLAGEFWKGMTGVSVDGVRVREHERFSAISLVKRFAWPAYFRERLELDREDLRYPDTATVAARLWLAEGPARDWTAIRNWSGQWLHWPRRDQEKDDGEPDVPRDVWELIHEKKRKQGPAPAYYAILMMDGDGLGKWLRGETMPPVRDVLHPQLAEYFRKLNGGQNPPGLEAPRPVGPALHASLSEALTNFALHFVPAIVERHGGTLIYAGGDDVLALLPTRTALACAGDLRETYRRKWAMDEEGHERLLMGSRATVSAGLVVVHYKEDLRFALQAARDAEKAAKNGGRDALALRVCRRSGEDAEAILGWGQAVPLELMIEHFAAGVTDRWAYRLRAELPTLTGEAVPWEAARAEVRRLLGRIECPDEERRKLFISSVERLLDSCRDEYGSPCRRGQDDDAAVRKRALRGFVTLSQSASFLARGRDDR
jgi:CRISPR-associated protein Cmr2